MWFLIEMRPRSILFVTYVFFLLNTTNFAFRYQSSCSFVQSQKSFICEHLLADFFSSMFSSYRPANAATQLSWQLTYTKESFKLIYSTPYHIMRTGII